jgi:hypothetical protein
VRQIARGSDHLLHLYVSIMGKSIRIEVGEWLIGHDTCTSLRIMNPSVYLGLNIDQPMKSLPKEEEFLET